MDAKVYDAQWVKMFTFDSIKKNLFGSFKWVFVFGGYPIRLYWFKFILLVLGSGAKHNWVKL